MLAGLCDLEVEIDRATSTLSAPVADGPATLRRALDAYDAAGIVTAEIGIRRPTLDDVFLSLTGHHAGNDVDAPAAEPPGPGGEIMSGFTDTVNDVAVIAKRNTIKIRRVPEVLVFVLLSPIMFVLLFAYVFGNSIEIEGTSYREFLIAGIFAQTVLFGATFTGAGIAEDMQKGIIDRFRSLPMSQGAVLAGRTISDVIYNVLSLIVMGITGSARRLADPQLVARRHHRRGPAAALRLRVQLGHGAASVCSCRRSRSSTTRRSS